MILTALTGVSGYEDIIVDTLVDRMGVQGFIPQFLQVFKPAGINNKTGERGKRYIFLVPVDMQAVTVSTSKLKVFTSKVSPMSEQVSCERTYRNI